MGDRERQLQNEIDRLEDEVRVLGEEVVSLRHFIKSLQNVADTADRQTLPGDTMELLDEILVNVLKAINAEDGSLLVLDEDTEELVFVLAKGSVPQEQLAGFRLPPGQGIAGWVAKHREPTIVDDAHHDRRFFEGVDDTFKFHTKSILAAPIIGGGRVIGVIEVINKELGKSFTVDDLALLTLLCRFSGELLHSMEVQAAAENTNP